MNFFLRAPFVNAETKYFAKAYSSPSDVRPAPLTQVLFEDCALSTDDGVAHLHCRSLEGR